MSNRREYWRQYKAKKYSTPEGREALLAYSRRWREANPDKVRKYNRDRKNRPTATEQRERKSRQRARRALAAGFHTDKEWLELCERVQYKCAYCIIELGREPSPIPNLTKDHFVPLSKGGTDYIDNIVPCCLSCNSRKKDKTPDEFVQYMVKRIEGRIHSFDI